MMILLKFDSEDAIRKTGRYVEVFNTYMAVHYGAFWAGEVISFCWNFLPCFTMSVDHCLGFGGGSFFTWED